MFLSILAFHGMLVGMNITFSKTGLKTQNGDFRENVSHE
jgi:hypothetical protein